MKRKLSITLLILLNLAFVYVAGLWVWLSYGLFVMDVGAERGMLIANEKTAEILMWLVPETIGLFLINSLICWKLIANKKPLFTGLAVTLSEALIIAGFLFYHRQSYINYQRNSTQLFHYFNKRVEVRAEIIKGTGIIEVHPLDEFLDDIGNAKYKPGIWKFSNSVKVILYLEDGTKDSIQSNGQIFGPYDGKYFSTEENVLEKYMVGQ